MENLLKIVKKIIPKKLFKTLQPIYHYKLALLGAVLYRFPSKKIKVIGITGTKGKSSTTEMIAHTLRNAGFKTASASTVRFQIAENSKKNMFKMTMPGRFFIQKFLRDAVNQKCEFAVIEISSEGAKQYRHKFIDLNALVFTNLAKEHIESHGSYEKYVEAKLSIAEALSKSSKNPRFMIGNIDDAETEKFFKKASPAKSIPYSFKDIKNFIEKENSVEFEIENQKIHSNLVGKFNVYNWLATWKTVSNFGVSIEQFKKAVEELKEIPGRAQIVKKGDVECVIDYAHTGESLEAIYKAFPNKKRICILGNTGGGRDVWKRPEMAKIADRYCETVILTNEDPYDEDPMKIINDMAVVIPKEKLFVEIDRRKAINTAIKMATKESVVIITGKGTDPYIMGKNGEKTPWDDKNVAEEELSKIKN